MTLLIAQIPLAAVGFGSVDCTHKLADLVESSRTSTTLNSESGPRALRR